MPPPGLKEQFGVSDPAPASSDKQSQAFKAAFQAEIEPINSNLQYTAVNAEEAAHAPFATRRDALMTAYQSALGTIDPADEAKAKPAIDKVTGDAKALNGEVGKFKADAEKAFNDWQERHPKLDAAVHQVEELEAWGHAKAPPLRGLVDGIRTETDKKRYAPACATLDQLLPKLQPIYDEYVQQKAAKEKYDAALTALQPRLAKVSVSKYAKLEPQQKEIADGQKVMEEAAQSKDFIKALEAANGLTAKVEALETALAALEAKKKEYETALAALQPRFIDGPQPYAKLEPMFQEINSARGQMETAAKGDDYEGALKSATDLKVKMDAYDAAATELKAKKKEYEDKLALVQLRVAKVSETKSVKLEPQQKAIADGQRAMEDAATGQDYAGALAKATDLETKLTAFEAAVTDLETKKKAYEDARKDVDSKSPGPIAPHVKLDAMTKDMGTLQQDMDNFAKSEDYESALKSAKDLSAKLDTFNSEVKKLEEEKKAFDAAYDEPFKKRLETVNQSTTAEMAPMQKSISEMKGQIDKAAASEDYVQATSLVGNLKSNLDTYESANATQTYLVKYKGKEYTVTAKERAELMLKISVAGIKETLDPLKNKAQAYAGQYNDLKSLAETGSGYVIYAVIYTASLGKATIGPVGDAVAAQEKGLNDLANAISSNPAGAQAACDAAVKAINVTGKAISDYMDAMESGGGRTIVALEVIAAVSFTIAAALGGAALVEAGVIVSAAGANAAAGAGFGALESIANTAIAPAAWGDANKINASEVVTKALLAAVVNGGASALGTAGGGGAGKVVEKVMLEKGFKTVGMRLVIKDMVENGLNSAITAAVQKTPDLVTGKTTWEKFWEAIAIGFATGAAIGPALGKLQRNSPLFKGLKDEEIDAAFAEAKPDFVKGATEDEINAAVNAPGKSGTGFELPGQNPATGEGLQKVKIKSDSNKPIGRHENMDFTGIDGAPGGKVEVRHHSENPNAPQGSKSRDNPSTQVNSKDKQYRLPDGTYKKLADMTDAEKAAVHYD